MDSVLQKTLHLLRLVNIIEYSVEKDVQEIETVAVNGGTQVTLLTVHYSCHEVTESGFSFPDSLSAFGIPVFNERY